MRSSKIVYEKSCDKNDLKTISFKSNKLQQTSRDCMSPDPVSSSPPSKFIINLYSRMIAFSSDDVGAGSGTGTGNSLTNSKSLIKV